MKSIAKRQQSYEQRFSWNSATAYVVFVLVVFTALKFAWDARVDSVTAETAAEERRERAAPQGEPRAREARGGDGARRGEGAGVLRARAAEQARGRHRRLREREERAGHEDRARHLRRRDDARADRARAGTVPCSGQDKARVQRWQEAATAFEDSLSFKDDSAVAPQAKLGLAEAYRHLSRQKDAVPLLTQLLESPPDKELEDDALYELAHCQTDLQAWNDAKTAWRQLIRRFPDSHFVPEARLELAQLAQMH